jgi:hypothetical protein
MAGVSERAVRAVTCSGDMLLFRSEVCERRNTTVLLEQTHSNDVCDWRVKSWVQAPLQLSRADPLATH